MLKGRQNIESGSLTLENSLLTQESQGGRLHHESFVILVLLRSKGVQLQCLMNPGQRAEKQGPFNVILKEGSLKESAGLKEPFLRPLKSPLS